MDNVFRFAMTSCKRMTHIYSCCEERKQCMNHKKACPKGHRVQSRIFFCFCFCLGDKIGWLEYFHSSIYSSAPYKSSEDLKSDFFWDKKSDLLQSITLYLDPTILKLKNFKINIVYIICSI